MTLELALLWMLWGLSGPVLAESDLTITPPSLARQHDPVVITGGLLSNLTHRFPWGPFEASKLASIPGDAIGRETPRCGLLPRIVLGIGQMWRPSSSERS